MSEIRFLACTFGGVAESVMTALFEAGHLTMARYSAQDGFIATGRAYADMLSSAEGIAQAAPRIDRARLKGSGMPSSGAAVARFAPRFAHVCKKQLPTRGAGV